MNLKPFFPALLLLYIACLGEAILYANIGDSMEASAAKFGQPLSTNGNTIFFAKNGYKVNSDFDGGIAGKVVYQKTDGTNNLSLSQDEINFFLQANGPVESRDKYCGFSVWGVPINDHGNVEWVDPSGSTACLYNNNTMLVVTSKAYADKLKQVGKEEFPPWDLNYTNADSNNVHQNTNVSASGKPLAPPDSCLVVATNTAEKTNCFDQFDFPEEKATRERVAAAKKRDAEWKTKSTDFIQSLRKDLDITISDLSAWFPKRTKVEDYDIIAKTGQAIAQSGGENPFLELMKEDDNKWGLSKGDIIGIGSALQRIQPADNSYLESQINHLTDQNEELKDQVNYTKEAARAAKAAAFNASISASDASIDASVTKHNIEQAKIMKDLNQ